MSHSYIRRAIIMPECEKHFLSALRKKFEKHGFSYHVRYRYLESNRYNDFCRQFNWYDCLCNTFVVLTVRFKDDDVIIFSSVVKSLQKYCETSFRLSANPYHCSGKSDCFKNTDIKTCDLVTSDLNCEWNPCSKRYRFDCNEYFDGRKCCYICKCGECTGAYFHDTYRKKKTKTTESQSGFDKLVGVMIEMLELKV